MARGKEREREGMACMDKQALTSFEKTCPGREGGENFQKGKRGTGKKRIGQVQWRAGGWIGPRWRRENAAEEQEGPY